MMAVGFVVQDLSLETHATAGQDKNSHVQSWGRALGYSPYLTPKQSRCFPPTLLLQFVVRGVGLADDVPHGPQAPEEPLEEAAAAAARPVELDLHIIGGPVGVPVPRAAGALRQPRLGLVLLPQLQHAVLEVVAGVLADAGEHGRRARAAHALQQLGRQRAPLPHVLQQLRGRAAPGGGGLVGKPPQVFVLTERFADGAGRGRQAQALLSAGHDAVSVHQGDGPRGCSEHL